MPALSAPIIIILAIVAHVSAHALTDKDADRVQRSSTTHGPFASTPRPFQSSGLNPRTHPAISTGYYFVDSDERSSDVWRPLAAPFRDTLFNQTSWFRILSGPNQKPSQHWTDPRQNQTGGWAYFRNPGNQQDSTDNAFAGPIAIGFPFAFNGVRQDSFYVSTNGLIAFSNRRYFYDVDQFGFPVSRRRSEVRPGTMSAYDPQSDDIRTRSGDGLLDATADDWGLQQVACGGKPSNPESGMRSRTNSMLDSAGLSSIWGSVMPQIIAPAWDDLQVSVRDPSTGVVDDFSRVYFRRSASNDTLVIYFVNLTPIGTKQARVRNQTTQTVDFAPDNRPTSGEHYRFSMQVILCRNDSSLTIHYERFHGRAPAASPNPLPASTWVRCNSTIGIAGPSRRLNWSGFPSPLPTSTELDYSAPKYLQSTEYLYNVSTDPAGGVRAGGDAATVGDVPKDFLAIGFKQHRNVARCVSTSYRIRERRSEASLAFSRVVPADSVRGYEILAGDQRLGAVQPVAIVQRLANDVQGPQGANYITNGMNLRVQCQFINQATGEVIYRSTRDVTDAALRDTNLSQVFRCDASGRNNPFQPPGTAVLPYEFIKVVFPPFEPNPLVDKNIGPLTCRITVDALTNSGEPIRDQWPFDDTSGVALFSMRRLRDFADKGGEFHVINGVAVPSVLMWVNHHAEVVDGALNTHNPLPPMGEHRAQNAPEMRLNSPVLRLNRVTHDGSEIPAPGAWGGDEIRSFPIDLTAGKRPVLSISYQRAGKLPSIARGFSDLRLLGPEHRVGMMKADGYVTTYREPDKLLIEFARPSDDGVNGITNVKEWLLDYQGLKTEYVQPYQIWGGGGYARGFDEIEYNKQLRNNSLPNKGGIREDFYDDGKDAEFFKLIIPIPDTVLKWVGQGARNFRFRLRASCLMNTDRPGPVDDEDNFYIDNVKVLYDSCESYMEVSNLWLIQPYTMVPSSMLNSVSIRMRLAAYSWHGWLNTNISATFCKDNTDFPTCASNPIYISQFRLSWRPSKANVWAFLPSIDLRCVESGFVGARVNTFSYGCFEVDDLVKTFRLPLGPSIAYEDNPANPTNDVESSVFSGVSGAGLNAPGGRIAMRFEMPTEDILGYQAFWAERNKSPDQIEFAIYRDVNGFPGSQPVTSSVMVRNRGEDDLSQDSGPHFGRYGTYLLPKTIRLNRGRYWLSVRQIGPKGFELGASAGAMGMVTTLFSEPGAPRDSSVSLLVDRRFRVQLQNGQVPNNALFAYSGTANGADWKPFVPNNNAPLFPHLDAKGTVGGFETFTRGSWIPLLRPYFGMTQPSKYCNNFSPIELVHFDGRGRELAVDLFWQTATEQDNSGFFIERRMVSDPARSGEARDSVATGNGAADTLRPWQTIGFVPGAGNSEVTRDYSYTDREVLQGSTYEYRLRQVDIDGTLSHSHVVNVHLREARMSVLSGPFPDPSAGQAVFHYVVQDPVPVRFEIIDLMGALVAVLVDEAAPARLGTSPVEWDGRRSDGTAAPSGTYVARLTLGGRVYSKVMTLIR
ncbi:MAG: hypothetical protein FGM33_05185 [Candidatus Kapabacteria bacterium]|nr:hypothetical protein [Candidatus Kapabacteria bacterium]